MSVAVIDAAAEPRRHPGFGPSAESGEARDCAIGSPCYHGRR